MSIDYSPEAITRRLVKASELGRLCRSLRHAGPDLLPSPETPAYMLRGLTLKQWLAYHQDEAEKEQSSSTTGITEVPHGGY